jgi:flagellin
MPTILNNVTAMAAGRQLGVSDKGLQKAIERLTTGKRVNRASDDAAGMVAGTGFEVEARRSKEQVKGYQNDYFAAQALDGYLEEATNQAYRLAELEGSANTASTEYGAVQVLVVAAGLAGGATVAAGSTAAASLTAINAQRAAIAGLMATAQSNANMKGIMAENNFAQSETILGADMGAEMVNLTKYQILLQSGISALGNANQSSQVILGLFR